MSDIINMPRLAFLKPAKYMQNKTDICDFHNSPRPQFSMGLMLKGTGEYRFKGKSVTVTKGDIIFVPAGTTYISYWDKESSSYYTTIHFLFEHCELFPRNKSIEIQKITPNNFNRVSQLFEQIYKNFNNNIQFSVLRDFYDVLNILYPYIKFGKAKKLDTRIEQAVDYIDRNFRSKMTIDELASISNISTSHFYSRFKECIGCTPIEYKQRISIRNAELMLTNDAEITIEQISSELGFSSSIYFRELFKKITGKTPTEYRKYILQYETT